MVADSAPRRPGGARRRELTMHGKSLRAEYGEVRRDPTPQPRAAAAEAGGAARRHGGSLSTGLRKKAGSGPAAGQTRTRRP